MKEVKIVIEGKKYGTTAKYSKEYLKMVSIKEAIKSSIGSLLDLIKKRRSIQ